jgi:energy-converting hydrogenase Eha subunit A
VSNTVLILLITAMIATVVALTLGLGAFGRGKPIGKLTSNKLMRLRIIGQGIAVILVVLLVWLKGGN